MTKLNPGGSALYSSYLGGVEFDQGNSIAVDPAGAAYITGFTASTDFPTTPDPIRQTGSNDAFVAKLTISADLAVSLTDLPDPVMVNNQLTYTLVVSNNGPDPAIGVVATDTLPNGVSLVSVTPGQGSCSGSSVINCSIGDLGPNAQSVITIIARPTTTGLKINVASVSSATPDINLVNNAASQSTQVSTLPSIFGRIVNASGSGFNGVNVALTGGRGLPP